MKGVVREIRALVLLAPLAVALLACSGSLTEEAPEAATIELIGFRDELLLLGSPHNPSYQASYPNPDGLDRMVVTLERGGKLSTRCEGGEASVGCADSPFFVDVDQIRRGWMAAKVFDMYGELVTQREVASVTMEVEAREEMCDPFDEFCDPDEESRDAPPVPSAECERPEEKKWFCDNVNAELERRQVDYRLDCQALPDVFTMDSPPERFRDTPVRRCRDIIEVPEETIEEIFDRRDDDCGERKLRAWRENTRYKLLKSGVCRISPIIIDLDGDGFVLSSPSQGASFDLLAEGRRVRAAWPLERGDALDDAFLAIDVDHNGTIDSGAELFGNATFGLRFDDGFQALASLDDNADGRVDPKDRAFDRLVLWLDEDGDGVSRPEELSSLESRGVTALFTRRRALEGNAAHDAHGNGLALRGSFRWANGETGSMVDAMLRYIPEARPIVAMSRP